MTSAFCAVNKENEKLYIKNTEVFDNYILGTVICQRMAVSSSVFSQPALIPAVCMIFTAFEIVLVNILISFILIFVVCLCFSFGKSRLFTYLSVAETFRLLRIIWSSALSCFSAGVAFCKTAGQYFYLLFLGKLQQFQLVCNCRLRNRQFMAHF